MVKVGACFIVDSTVIDGGRANTRLSYKAPKMEQPKRDGRNAVLLQWLRIRNISIDLL